MTFANLIAAIDPLELAAACLGVVNIVLLVRRSIWNYPFGLATVALYARVFFAQRLYSDAALQIFFFAAQLYGWWAWARAGGAIEPVPVRRLPTAARLFWVGAVLMPGSGWGSAMRAYTDAAFPWADATLTIASMAAQLLLARRFVENWMLWIAVDACSVGLYLAKGLLVTAILYLLFLGLAAAGLRAWRGALRDGRALA